MTKSSKTDAEAKYARTQKRAFEAARATNDAQAESKRVDDNTARLRALRLAKEAADVEAAKRAPPAPAKKAARPRAAKAVSVRKLNAENDG